MSADQIQWACSKCHAPLPIWNGERGEQICPNGHRVQFTFDLTQVGTPALTDDEIAFMKLTAELANLGGQIIGNGPSRTNDLHEMVDKIHQLQHTVMAQAAARMYPDLFRLLGGTIGSPTPSPIPHCDSCHKQMSLISGRWRCEPCAVDGGPA